MSAPPRPGTSEAKDSGCTCPVTDNCHGKGRHGDGKRFGWFICIDCPIHKRNL